jgi:hypothetical protein
MQLAEAFDIYASGPIHVNNIAPLKIKKNSKNNTGYKGD